MKIITALLAVLLFAAPGYAITEEELVEMYVLENAVTAGQFDPGKAIALTRQFYQLTEQQRNTQLSNYIDGLVADIDADLTKVTGREAALNARKTELQTFQAGL